ncbi:mandelate racemase/muconate lactonizing enzyme family protein [Catelliglobosispora koreensis]|uniref:mandelate racemase/muconate lactonizing enzyme family protein n=1 Tax=Catelliglobosispora koreensis TaxID=129052 RepID=UPI000372AE83|nr:mandelate racemase/muconate lactonizing enzyme family protein [Catelliglobosispora koreensis]
MKVTRLETFVLSVPQAGSYWGAQAWKKSFIYSDRVQAVLVRVETSDGVVGWGEAKAPVGPRASAAIIDELLAPIVLDSRVDEISLTWDRMYAGMRVRGHDSGFWLEAMSGVDIALWDAFARTVNQPVYVLLGGRYRDEVPVYASGISARDPQQARDIAAAFRDHGFKATKVAIGKDPRHDVAVVEAVCSVFDEVYADAAGAYDYPQALAVGRELTRLGVRFFEMPVAPEFLDLYATLASKLDIPLALDSLASRYRAVEFLKRGALHVLQPDVCRAGGITEVMRIAALASSFGAQTTPHVSIGSAIHFAASLQCAAAIPDFTIMEHWAGQNPIGRLISPDYDTPKDSRRVVPATPGLGITVDEEAVRRIAVP